MYAYDYVVESCKILRDWSETDGRKFTNKHKNAVKANYGSEINISDELGDELATRFQQMVGILRLSVELGRIGIITEVSFLSSFNISPREGHLEAAYCVFEYLYHHKTGGCFVFNDAQPEVDEGQFKEDIWKSIYGYLTIDILSNMLEPRENPVTILMFCDAAFADDLVTRKSQSDILTFINGVPITWYSKRQNTVEALILGSEFITWRVGCEINDGLRYKLRMMRVPIKGPTNIYCDNEAVISNFSMVELTLKKKHLSVCYHKTRECYDKGAVRIENKPTKNKSC